MNQIRLSLRNCRYLTLAGLIGLSVSGCDRGPRMSKVTVRVKHGEKTLNNIQVTFVPERGGGPSASGFGSKSCDVVMMTNGKQGVLPGSYRVAFDEPVKPMTPELIARGGIPPPSFPSKYTSPLTSGLTANVGDKAESLEFVLEVGPPNKIERP